MGKLILDSALNLEGFKKGFNKALAATRRFVDNVTNNIAGVEKSFDNSTAAIMKQQDVVDELKRKIQAISDIKEKAPVFEKLTSDLKLAENELKNITVDYEKAVATLETVKGLGWKDDSLVFQKAIADATNAKHALRNSREDVDGLKRALAELNMPEQPKETAEELSSKLAIAQKKLSELQDKASQVGKTAPKAMRDTSKAAQSAAKQTNAVVSGMERFVKRIKSLVSAVLVFQVIRSALRGLRDYLGTVLKANQDFVNSFAQVKGNIAASFQPILQAVIPILAQLMKWLASATASVLQFVAAISGKSVKSLQAASKGMDKLSSSTKLAGKEAKGSLSSWDELENKITAASGAGADDGITAAYTEIDEPDLTFWDKLKAKLQDIADIFMSGFWEGFANADLSKLQTAVIGIGNSLKDIFTDPAVVNAAKNFADNFIYNLGKVIGSAASIGISVATGLLGGINLFLKKNKDSIKRNLISMFDIGSEIFTIVGNWWNAIADIFSVFAEENSKNMISNVLGIFYEIGRLIGEVGLRAGIDFIDSLTAPIIENKDKIKVVLDEILGFFSDITGTIKDTIQYAVDGIIALYDTHIKPFIDTVKEAFTEWFEHLLDGWNNYIQPVLDNFSEKFTEIVEEHIKPMIDKAMEFFGKLFDALSSWWNKVLKPLVSWMIDTFAPIIGAALGVVGDIFNTLLSTVGDIVSSIFDVLSGLIDFLVGVFTGDWEKAWNGVKRIFTGLGNAIISIVEGLINGVIAIINGFIKGINVAIGVINNIPGVSIPVITTITPLSIPRLATGTVVPPNKEFMALLGDNRNEPEVVSPLSTMKQAFLEAMAEGGGAGNNTLLQDIKDLLEEIASQEGRVIFPRTAEAGRAVRHVLALDDAVRG